MFTKTIFKINKHIMCRSDTEKLCIKYARFIRQFLISLSWWNLFSYTKHFDIEFFFKVCNQLFSLSYKVVVSISSNCQKFILHFFAPQVHRSPLDPKFELQSQNVSKRLHLQSFLENLLKVECILYAWKSLKIKNFPK